MQPLANKRELQDLALSFCAIAAHAVALKRSGKEQLTNIDKAMSYVFRLAPEDVRIKEPGAFIDFLRTPLPSWLDPSESTFMDEYGEPSDFCFSIIEESGPDPAAERTQRLIADSRNYFSTLPDGDVKYASFRKQLIQSGHVDRLDALAIAAGVHLDLAELFQAIPHSCQYKNSFFPCPICSWPMPIAPDGKMACESQRCRKKGAIYQVRGNFVVPLGKAPVPQRVACDNMVQARRGVWRYTILPGLAELELERELSAIPGVSTIMWPHFDVYDLHVQTGEMAWKVDVKDWSNPIALAKHVADRVHSDICIVIPNDRLSGLGIIKEVCPGRSLFTIQQFANCVRKTLSME
jgi:hypothetical protein